MKKVLNVITIALIAISLMQCTPSKDQVTLAGLEKNFMTPPPEARPWVYWFWLNSNITREGITADLEAMKKAGIGGVLIMEVDQGAPVGTVPFMSDKWQELFKFMTSEANRLGIEVNMNDDAGWNGSGGPWVPLDKSMQMVVTSEKVIPAGKKFAGQLPLPPTHKDYYRDITVLAFPTPKDPDNPAYRIKNLAGKSMVWGGIFAGSLDESRGGEVPPLSMIDPKGIVDLSAQMDSTGNLSWDAPSLNDSPTGTWTVIRFGHTFTGAVNGPAPASGTGPECDKLSREGIEANYNGMIGKLVKDVGPLAGKTLAATHVDSWEVGSQNWTPKMREEFKRLRGYDMTPYMPVLTGRVVESPEISERFLRDLRQTISDLLAVNYIGHLRELANRDGLRLSMECYSTPANDLDVGNYIDEPISEFWTMDGGGFWWTQKSMSSLAHVNGLPVTGAEAFTSGSDERWLDHPAIIKSLGDRAFCDGVNRFIFHRYALQPWAEERVPGMTMGPWGLHYERTNTWWNDSNEWHTYLARCQYLLRQGSFVADVLCLNSEEPMERFRVLNLEGYDYDGISPQKFLKDASVEDGKVVLPSGMKYSLLVLPDDPDMSPELLKKISDLVEAGATVTGKAPVRAPGLSDYPACDERIRQLAARLWGNDTVVDRKVGMGRVVSGQKPEQILSGMSIRPDFISSPSMRYIHRSVDGVEIYFIASQEYVDTDFVCSFRVTGLKPEIWDPLTGKIQPVTVYQEKDGCTLIPMRLEVAGSRFVIFRSGKTPDSERIVSVKADGKEMANWRIEPKKKVPAVREVPAQKDFTMAAWVKPGMEIALPKENNQGAYALSVERNDVVYPAPGHEVWSELDAGAGFGVGTNGVMVTEHSADYLPPLLVKSVPINGWAHIAIVYHDNVPSLWINGRFVKKGLKGPKRVHGSIGVVHTRKVKPFNGRVLNLVQFPEALTEKELLKLALEVPDTTEVPVTEPSFNLLTREITANGTLELESADGKIHTVTTDGLPGKQTIAGPWEVSFTPGWGAPEKITMDRLVSWSRYPDDGVKYYSGSASYHNTFNFTPVNGNGNGTEPIVYLDLGRVAVMAEVTLNGQNLGVVWRAPYRVDITKELKAGGNDLEIRVVNLWINRMIGDEQLPDDSERNPNGTLKKWPQWLLDGKPSPTGRYTFTTWRLWSKGSPLQESGLIGPVSLKTVMKYHQ